VTWSQTVRWYGVGMLIGTKYLPPTGVVACPDFSTANGSNFSAKEGFSLTDAYHKCNGDPGQIWSTTGANEGSYVLNTLPFYSKDPSCQSKGKLTGGGRSGGFWAAGPWSGVPHIRALMMCLSTYRDADPNPATLAHQRKGVNVTYIDGHVAWQPISDNDWAILNLNWPNSTANDLGGYYTNSFYVWATLRE
jgi:prepilin-type processing-associated H-X9-DG protein